MKPLTKMEYYYDLDQEIVQFYTQMVKSEPCLKKDLSMAENLYSDKVSSVKDDPLTKHAAGNLNLVSMSRILISQILHSFVLLYHLSALLLCL